MSELKVRYEDQEVINFMHTDDLIPVVIPVMIPVGTQSISMIRYTATRNDNE